MHTEADLIKLQEAYIELDKARRRLYAIQNQIDVARFNLQQAEAAKVMEVYADPKKYGNNDEVRKAYIKQELAIFAKDLDTLKYQWREANMDFMRERYWVRIQECRVGIRVEEEGGELFVLR